MKKIEPKILFVKERELLKNITLTSQDIRLCFSEQPYFEWTTKITNNKHPSNDNCLISLGLATIEQNSQDF